ncbi:ankyrin repeat domain-containing protein, partial [Thiomicrospira microaerophila]|uniref:ankyrin repeat domain-containing protein n=1 Tax=Thiomicrospira microaerophila TaxID=406020 RepID=UPI001E64DC1C
MLKQLSVWLVMVIVLLTSGCTHPTKIDAHQTAELSDITPIPDTLALIEAMDQSDIAAIENFLLRGGNVNVVDEQGVSLLYASIYLDELDIFELLLSHKADVNQADSNGWTPLMVAVYHNRVDMVNRLLALGANPNAMNDTGRTALHFTVNGFRWEQDSEILAKALIDAGAQINATNHIGNTALMGAVFTDKTKTFVYLMSLNADVNVINIRGHNALMLAIIKKRPEM